MIQLGIVNCPKCNAHDTFFFNKFDNFICQTCNSKFFVSFFNFPFFNLKIYDITNRHTPEKILSVSVFIEL